MRTVIDHLGCHTTTGDANFIVNVKMLVEGVNLKLELDLTKEKLNDALTQVDLMRSQLDELKQAFEAMKQSSEKVVVEVATSTSDDSLEKATQKNVARKSTKASE
jgi:hypothetical protein